MIDLIFVCIDTALNIYNNVTKLLLLSTNVNFNKNYIKRIVKLDKNMIRGNQHVNKVEKHAFSGLFFDFYRKRNCEILFG